MSRPALTLRIRADKSGPKPAEGQPWPLLGVELHDLPDDEVLLPTSFVVRHLGAPWFQVHEIGVVERPSRPGPGVDENGSTVVVDEHRLPAEGLQAPHVFRHIERFVIDTLNLGVVTLEVTRQPDKYVDSDDPTEQVTPEVYAEGRTRVDHFYTCTVETSEA